MRGLPGLEGTTTLVSEGPQGAKPTLPPLASFPLSTPGKLVHGRCSVGFVGYTPTENDNSPPHLSEKEEEERRGAVFRGKWEDPKITKRQAITVVYLARVKPEKTPGVGPQQAGAFVIHMFCQPQGTRAVERYPAYIKTNSEDVSISFCEIRIMVQPTTSEVGFLS